MKTVIIYDQCGMAPLEFFVVDGDKSHLNGVFINNSECDESLMDELSTLLYDKDTGEELMAGCEEFPSQEVKDGAFVIVAGFLP